MTDLKEGEIVCNKCGGTKHIEVKRNPKKSGPYHPTEMCPKCFGTGKLDWIENITGIKQKFFRWDLFPKIKPEFLKGFLFKPLPELRTGKTKKSLN